MRLMTAIRRLFGIRRQYRKRAIKTKKRTGKWVRTQEHREKMRQHMIGLWERQRAHGVSAKKLVKINTNSLNGNSPEHNG